MKKINHEQEAQDLIKIFNPFPSLGFFKQALQNAIKAVELKLDTKGMRKEERARYTKILTILNDNQHLRSIQVTGWPVTTPNEQKQPTVCRNKGNRNIRRGKGGNKKRVRKVQGRK